MNLRAFVKLGILTIAIIFSSCSGSEYSRLVKEEMAKGSIHDSLLFDMKFGQHKQEFFQACWRLNQQGIVSNGPGNTSVKYELPLQVDAPLESAMTLLFFGDFNDRNIMTGMDFQFYYNAWSIWNKNLQADKLVPVVMDSIREWYPGNDFIKVPLEKDSVDIFVKVDGNRRIVIKPLDDDRIVRAKIDDLRYVLDEKYWNDF